MDTSKRLPPERERMFPELFSSGYGVTSDFDVQYNCIAWAVGEDHNDEFWTPFAIGGGYYWPSNKLPNNAAVETFIKLYEIEGGYEVKENDDDALEEGIEKVALYADDKGEITHAARQKEDGMWTSKLGDWEDIDHKTLAGLSGDDPAYGHVVKILRRHRRPL